MTFLTKLFSTVLGYPVGWDYVRTTLIFVVAFIGAIIVSFWMTSGEDD